MSAKEHPQAAYLERFTRGLCTKSERQQVVRHLLTGCISCSAYLRDLLSLGGRGVRTAPAAELSAPAAESKLLATRRGFIETGRPYEAALISLTLATIYLKMERLGEMAELVAEMLPIFRSLGVKRETIASLILWKKVEGTSTLAVLETIAAELRAGHGRQAAG